MGNSDLKITLRNEKKNKERAYTDVAYAWK